ncbi:hybrid sensor histidine kinase/response regulator [Terriglobus albidus]|uniref:hybrid sensor histidine kinase/response regulator n=1 Tax=Terriglobus albidus TaxID=1592106 RepID=UPI0021DFF3E1|nr:ATP-binding protein [Terriglobus albidus]
MSKAEVPRWPQRIHQATAGLLVLVALAVLWGWAADNVRLKSVVSGWPRMVVPTAVCFLLAGIALGLLPLVRESSSVRRRSISFWASQGLSLLVVVMGLSRLLSYALGRDSGIDHLFYMRFSAMAPATAINFILLGTASLLAGRRRGFQLFQVLTLLANLIAWLAFSRFLYGGAPLIPQDTLAVHTSLLFLVWSVALLCSWPEDGLMSLLVSDSAGGLIARKLLFPAMIVPISVGWLRLQGQRAGWYGTEAGLSLFALSNVVTFGILVWITAAALHRSDLSRRNGEWKLLEQLARLDLLRQITQAIGERQDMQSIFQVVLRSLEDDLPIDFGCIALYDRAGMVLTVSNVGVRQAVLADLRHTTIGIDENGFGRSLNGQLIYEPDLDRLTTPFPRQLVQGGLHSGVIVPLMVEDALFGILIAARREWEGFSSSDCEFLKHLGDLMALAAHQAQMYGSLQRAYDDLQSTRQTVMQQERLRAFGQMASGIAHDINNTISPAALYTESLLEMETGLSRQSRRTLQTIQRALNDVSNTLTRLTDLYRQREPQVVSAPIDLNQLVRQTIELTNARWSAMPQQHGIVIRMVTDLAHGIPLIRGLENEIREVLVNLIFNAVDAMPNGGTLTLRTGIAKTSSGKDEPAEMRGVYLEVIDTGVGMDEEARRRCMEPFFTTKGDRGTGLGLVMVQGVMERHSGELEIDSALAKGTTVRLTFTATEAAVSAPAPAAHAGPISKPVRILLVDDDPLLLKPLREVLELDGHDVVTANGGQSGIDAFHAALSQNKPFSIVFTDLGMPYVDGKKVALSIKEAAAATPVILLTGWGYRSGNEDETPANVDLVLSKPTRRGDLRSAVERFSSNTAS